MDYGQFTSTTGPYTGVKPVVADKTYVSPTQGPYTGVDPGQGYATVKPPAAADTQGPDFTYLSAITDGVGDYHINHFIAYFDPIIPNNAPSLSSFYAKFCDVFSVKNIADVSNPGRRYNDLPAYKFELGGNLGAKMQKLIGVVHDDWVAMQMFKDGKSFYGETLQRNWFEPADKLILTNISPLLAPIAYRMTEVNRKHFLAGRRSWSFGYDDALQLYYVETAALERSSDMVYATIEMMGFLREDIINLWCNLLENFIKFFGMHAKDISSPAFGAGVVPAGYTVSGNVAYCTDSNKEIFAAAQTPWFVPVLQRHLGLIENLVPDQK